MIRRPPRSTQSRSSAASDVYKRQGTYHAWRGERGAGEYADVPGFCASATTEQIAEHQHILTPGRYVGAEDVEEDDEPLDEKIGRLTKKLYEAFEESDRLQVRVRTALGRLQVIGDA